MAAPEKLFNRGEACKVIERLEDRYGVSGKDNSGWINGTISAVESKQEARLGRHEGWAGVLKKRVAVLPGTASTAAFYRLGHEQN